VRLVRRPRSPRADAPAPTLARHRRSAWPACLLIRSPTEADVGQEEREERDGDSAARSVPSGKGVIDALKDKPVLGEARD
jgi:hypothetical protein